MNRPLLQIRLRLIRNFGPCCVALAALVYLMLPGLFAIHVAYAHPHAEGSVAHLIGCDDDDADEPSPAQHGDLGGDIPVHHHGDTHCELCHLLGTLGGSGEMPAFATPRVTSSAVQAAAFSPRGFCLPADPQSKPAAPRAPPAC